MDNKYYIPNIEEFHVGFYYQFKYDGEVELDIEHENRWHDRRVTSSHYDPYMADRSIEAGRIRVRYLDQKDIESLGFKNMQRVAIDWYELEGKFEDGWCHYGYWNFVRLLHDRELNRVKIIAYEFKSDKDENVLFQGSCKNKSELKKILKQLNIK